MNEQLASLDDQTEDSPQQEDRMKRLQTILREATAKNTSLETELTKSKSLLSKLTDELARVRAEFNAYVSASKEGITNLGQENERLRNDLREKTDQLVKLESKTMMLSQIGVMDPEDIDTLKDEIMETSARLRGENEALREALQKAEDKGLRDVRKLHQIQEQLQTRLEENRKLSSEQKRLEVELEALQQDRDALEQNYLEVQAAKNQLEKQTAEEQVLQISLQRAREKVREQQKLIESLKTQVSDLLGKYGAATHQLETLEEKDEHITQLSAKLDEYRSRVSELEGKLGIVTHQLETWDKREEQATQLSTKLEEYRTRISELESQYAVALHRLEALDEKEEQVTQLSQQLVEYKSQLTELQYQSQMVEKQKQILTKTQEELSNLQELYEQAKVEIQRLEKSNIVVQEQEETIEKLRKESISYRAQIAGLNAEIETLHKYKGRLTESQDAVSDLMSRIAGMASKITSLKTELKTSEKEKEKLLKEQQNELIRLNEQVGAFQSEIQTLQTIVITKNTEMDALEARANEAEAQLATVQVSISRTLAADEKLEAFSAESVERTMSLEKKLEIFELTADGLTKMKENLARERERLQDKVQMVTTYEQVLQNTELGKVFLLVKALGTTNIDHLSRALGIPKHNLQSSIRELTQMELVQLDKKKVTFIKSEVVNPPA